MPILRLLLLAAIVFMIPSQSNAIEYQINGSVEREEFMYTKVSSDGTIVPDEIDDIIVFDRHHRNEPPSLLADITQVEYRATDDGWDVVFTVAEEIPEDPGMAVNFFVYIDSDGNKKNNAPNGVYRTNTDTTYMILHGTRTKWHSKRWLYDSKLGRWTEQPDKPQFTLGTTEFTLHIPYSEVPKKDGIEMRAFSLTAEKALTAIDIAPGTGIPKVLQQPIHEPKEKKSENSGGTFHTVFLLGVCVLLGVSIYKWKKS